MMQIKAFFLVLLVFLIPHRGTAEVESYLELTSQAIIGMSITEDTRKSASFIEIVSTQQTDESKFVTELVKNSSKRDLKQLKRKLSEIVSDFSTSPVSYGIVGSPRTLLMAALIVNMHIAFQGVHSSLLTPAEQMYWEPIFNAFNQMSLFSLGFSIFTDFQIFKDELLVHRRHLKVINAGKLLVSRIIAEIDKKLETTGYEQTQLSKSYRPMTELLGAVTDAQRKLEEIRGRKIRWTNVHEVLKHINESRIAKVQLKSAEKDYSFRFRWSDPAERLKHIDHLAQLNLRIAKELSKPTTEEIELWEFVTSKIQTFRNLFPNYATSSMMLDAENIRKRILKVRFDMHKIGAIAKHIVLVAGVVIFLRGTLSNVGTETRSIDFMIPFLDINLVQIFRQFEGYLVQTIAVSGVGLWIVQLASFKKNRQNERVINEKYPILDDATWTVIQQGIVKTQSKVNSSESDPVAEKIAFENLIGDIMVETEGRRFHDFLKKEEGFFSSACIRLNSIL